MVFQQVKDFVGSAHFRCFLFGSSTLSCLVQARNHKDWKRYLSILAAVCNIYSAYNTYQQDKKVV